MTIIQTQAVVIVDYIQVTVFAVMKLAVHSASSIFLYMPVLLCVHLCIKTRKPVKCRSHEEYRMRRIAFVLLNQMTAKVDQVNQGVT